MSNGVGVLTFGEAMLRLTPPGHARIAQAQSLEIWVAGSESNVAAGIYALGGDATWVSRLPDNMTGRKIESTLKACGVDVSHIVWIGSNNRTGLIFAEQGTSPRPTSVVYDRKNSAASSMSPSDLPDSLFKSHKHLHVSGITPALSQSCHETVADALDRAKSYGLTTSFDVNYRSKLWSAKDATSVLGPLITGVDILICSSGDASTLFGISSEPEKSVAELKTRFNAKIALLTLGSDGAVGSDETGVYQVAAIPVEKIVDRFGSGDAFTAGFLCGYLEGKPTQQSIRMGVGAASLKRTIPGDILMVSRAELDAVLDASDKHWR